MSLTMRDLPPGDPGWDAAFGVLAELHTHLDAATFAELHVAGAAQGLMFTAAYGEDGTCLGVAGWRVQHTASRIRNRYVDDLSVTRTRRSAGVGSALLEHLSERARRMGCRALDLDCGVQRADAHRFYEREGMTMTSRHYTMKLV